MIITILCLCREQQASHVHLAGYEGVSFLSMVCTVGYLTHTP